MRRAATTGYSSPDAGKGNSNGKRDGASRSAGNAGNAGNADEAGNAGDDGKNDGNDNGDDDGTSDNDGCRSHELKPAGSWPTRS